MLSASKLTKSKFNVMIAPNFEGEEQMRLRQDRLVTRLWCDRRTLLRGIAASAGSVGLIASKDAVGEVSGEATSFAAADANTVQNEVTHRTLPINGLRFHIAEQGQGPLVLLCHGFPECWYSWRHQLPALAGAGFHAVAPDMRGFGQTEAPDDIASYTIVHNVADMVQLVSALGEQQAVIIGHDWGAPVAWNAALLRPDTFRAVVAMSVPYRVRPPVAPLKALREAGTTTFYWQYFRTPGVAEAEFEGDIARTVRTLLYGKGISLMMKSGEGFLTGTTIPEQLPPWLTQEDITYYIETFKRTGYRGGLNWYRNIDRNWELSAAWEGAKIRQPALFIAGSEDGVVKFAAKPLEQMPSTVPGLKKALLIPGAGHWIQQERVAEVNAAVLEFIRSV
jgi:epoxide hydrolase A/B